MKKLILINGILIIIYLMLPKYTTYCGTVGCSGLIEIVCKENSKTIPNWDISLEMDLREPSRISAETYEKMFVKTKMSGLGKAFAEAEAKTGVNGIYLAALGCLESAWGTSTFANERNNLFGYQAYDSNLNATRYFETKTAGILYVANKIKANYLTKSGAYHSGYTVRDVSKRYASDPNHATKIYSIMKKLIKKGRD